MLPSGFHPAFNSRTDAFCLVITFPNSTVRFRRVSTGFLNLTLPTGADGGEDFVRTQFRACR